jgi:hypothetical protein
VFKPYNSRLAKTMRQIEGLGTFFDQKDNSHDRICQLDGSLAASLRDIAPAFASDHCPSRRRFAAPQDWGNRACGPASVLFSMWHRHTPRWRFLPLYVRKDIALSWRTSPAPYLAPSRPPYGGDRSSRDPGVRTLSKLPTERLAHQAPAPSRMVRLYTRFP